MNSASKRSRASLKVSMMFASVLASILAVSPTSLLANEQKDPLGKCATIDPRKSGGHTDLGDTGHSARDICYYSNAKLSGDVRTCDKIAEPYVNFICVEKVAITNKKPQICSDVKGGDQPAGPKPSDRFTPDLCLRGYIEKLNDLSACSFFRGTKPSQCNANN